MPEGSLGEEEDCLLRSLAANGSLEQGNCAEICLHCSQSADSDATSRDLALGSFFCFLAENLTTFFSGEQGLLTTPRCAAAMSSCSCLAEVLWA